MKRAILTIVAIFAAFAITASTSDAAISFNIENKSIASTPGNPTSGFVNVFITAGAGDLPLSVIGAQAHITPGAFTGSITGVTFGVMGEAIGLADQFPVANVFAVGASPGNVAGGTAQGTGTPLVSGSGVFSVPFTIAAGQSGTFRLNFVPGGPVATELYDSGFNTVQGVQFVGGTITITAVPEPSSIALALIGTIGTVAWRIRRRKLAIN